MKLLITGFDPFGGESINPAWEAVKLLPNMIDKIEVIKMQIPTVFHKSVEVLLEGIEEHKPDVVICVGQAGGRFDLTIERVGINIDDARIADNEGNQPIDVPVYSDGENAYFTTLPVKAMVEEAKKIGVPSSVSNTAGTFVCNHILYALLYHINKNNVAKKGGFIHVPYIPTQVLNKKNTAFMSLDMIAKGIEGFIKAIGQNDTDIKVTGGAEF